MGSILRRLTQRGSENPMKTDSDAAIKAVKLLSKSLETYVNHKQPMMFNEIEQRMEEIWISIFDVEKGTAPQKKYQLAEEILFRSDLLRLLLVVFHDVNIDSKRKIRDLYLFLHTWTSNDSVESSFPRVKSKPKFAPSFRNLLYNCRFEMFTIVSKGYDQPNSIGFYNDIIRVFVQDEDCLVSLLKDDGRDEHNGQQRSEGCVWNVLDRLTEHIDFRGFHTIAGFFETIEIIFGNGYRKPVKYFIYNNLTRFTQIFHKLISISNFFIQSKALKFIHELFDSPHHFEIRRQWMANPALIKNVAFALQSPIKTVRTEAAILLNMFVQNPNNSPDVAKFIITNRNILITYCWENAPIHYYKGLKCEEEDARFAEIAYKLLITSFERPLNQQEANDYEEMKHIQQKIYSEQTIQTFPQEMIPCSIRIPPSSHVYKTTVLHSPENLRSPMRFGKPRRQ
ncbi:CRE-MOP-25.3 protein [Caenorhabditis remanei]|uniref:CRE-MOP-25.3 protein n=1 Tax=Caenorhabditis remanei TaxID=31234 RepID=E3LM94_CAERE|nr:CRE-MOP-25.3 protein [Caenorhabditis remanei]